MNIPNEETIRETAARLARTICEEGVRGFVAIDRGMIESATTTLMHVDAATYRFDVAAFPVMHIEAPVLFESPEWLERWIQRVNRHLRRAYSWMWAT